MTIKIPPRAVKVDNAMTTKAQVLKALTKIHPGFEFDDLSEGGGSYYLQIVAPEISREPKASRLDKLVMLRFAQIIKQEK